MKKLMVLALAVFLPLMAEGHPGKTDRSGGHKCLKGCEEWGLFYKEYHLHDKDGKPIRIGRKNPKDPKNPVALESAATPTVVASPDGPRTDTAVVHRYVTTVYEENIIASNPLVWVLLFLLLLLLVLRRNRAEPRKR
jgi:competence protein ComEC